MKGISLVSRKKRLEDFRILLSIEVNNFSQSAFSLFRPKSKSLSIRSSDIMLKKASLSALKMWEFQLNPVKDILKGNVGKIVVVTRGLENRIVRKQRALLIAAEMFVYYMFAKNNPVLFRKAASQNQYADILKFIFGRDSASRIRDHAVRYIVSEMGEHELANFQGGGWFTRISKLKSHRKDIAKALGLSGASFHKVSAFQGKSQSPSSILRSPVLVKKELEEAEYLLQLLESRKKRSLPSHTMKMFAAHIKDLKAFIMACSAIIENIGHWKFCSRPHHSHYRQKLGMARHEINQRLLLEASADIVDMTLVGVLLSHFEKEKINIVRDLRL